MYLAGLIELARSKKMKKIFILIWVHHGLIQKPMFFSQREKAELKIKKIKDTIFNADYDEIEIFEKHIAIGT
jgi:hypothetical protein